MAARPRNLWFGTVTLGLIALSGWLGWQATRISSPSLVIEPSPAPNVEEVRYVSVKVPYLVTVETTPRPTPTPKPLPPCESSHYDTGAICRWKIPTQTLPLPTCVSPVANEVCVMRTVEPTMSAAYWMER